MTISKENFMGINYMLRTYAIEAILNSYQKRPIHLYSKEQLRAHKQKEDVKKPNSIYA